MSLLSRLLPSVVRLAPEAEAEALKSSWTGNFSLKRLLALEAGRALTYGMFLLVLCVEYQVLVHRAVDGNLVLALATLAGSVAVLAGAAYRKPEGGALPPVSSKKEEP